MRTAIRVLGFAVGLALFVWASSKMRVFNPDRALVAPTIAEILLVFVGVSAAVPLWLYAFVATEVRRNPHQCANGAALPPAESPEPSEPAAGLLTNEESSPPAV